MGIAAETCFFSGVLLPTEHYGDEPDRGSHHDGFSECSPALPCQ